MRDKWLLTETNHRATIDSQNLPLTERLSICLIPLLMVPIRYGKKI